MNRFDEFGSGLVALTFDVEHLAADHADGSQAGGMSHLR